MATADPPAAPTQSTSNPTLTTGREGRRMSTNPLFPQERRPAAEDDAAAPRRRRFKRCGTSEIVVFVALAVAAIIAVTAGSIAWDRLDGGDAEVTAARILGLIGVTTGAVLFVVAERQICRATHGVGPGLDLVLALSFGLINAGTVAIVVGVATSHFGSLLASTVTTSVLTVLTSLYLVLRLHQRWDGTLEPEDLVMPVGVFVSTVIVAAPWMICGVTVGSLDGSTRMETFMLCLAGCLSLVAAFVTRSHRLLLNLSMLTTTIVAAVWCGQEANANGDVSDVVYMFFTPVGVAAVLLILPAITTASRFDPADAKPADVRPYFYDTQHSAGDFMMLCVVVFALVSRFGAWTMGGDGLDVASLSAASLLAFLPAFLVGTAPRASVLGLLVVGFTPATDGLDVSAKNVITWGVALVVVALSRYPTVVQGGPVRKLVNARLFRRTPRVQRPNAGSPDPTPAELAELEAMEKLEAEEKARSGGGVRAEETKQPAPATTRGDARPTPSAAPANPTDPDALIDLAPICSKYYWMFLQFLVADRYGLAVQELFAATLSFIFTGWWAAPYSKYDNLEDGAVAMVAWPVAVPLLLLFAPVGRSHLIPTSSKRAKQVHLHLRRLSVTIAVLSLIAVPVSYASRTVSLIYLCLALLALGVLTRGGLLGLFWTRKWDVASMRTLGTRTTVQAASTAVVLTVVGSVGHLDGPEALALAVVFQVLTFMPFTPTGVAVGRGGAAALDESGTAPGALTRGLSRFGQSARRLMAADLRPIDFSAVVYIAPIVIADDDADHLRTLAVFLPFVFDALQMALYEWTWAGLTFKAVSRLGALFALAVVIHDERDDLSYLLGLASLLTAVMMVVMVRWGRSVDDPDTRGYLFSAGPPPTYFVLALVGIALVDRVDANAFYIFLLCKLALMPYVMLRHNATTGRVFGATVGLSFLFIFRALLPSTSPFDSDDAPWWADREVADDCTAASDPPCDTEVGRPWAQEWASNVAVGLFVVGVVMTGWILELYYAEQPQPQPRRRPAPAPATSVGEAKAAAADDDDDADSDASSVPDNWFTNPLEALPDEITALGILMCLAACFSVGGIVQSDGAYSITQAALNSAIVLVALGYTVWLAIPRKRRLPGPSFFAVVLVFSFLTRADGALMFIDLFGRLCVWMASYWRRWPSYSTAQLGCLVCCLAWIARVGMSRVWSDSDWRLATVSRDDDDEAWQFAMGVGVIAFTALSAILTIGYNARIRQMPSQGFQQAVAVMEGLLLIAGISLTMPTSIAFGIVALVVLALLLWRSPSLGFVVAPITVFVTVFQFEWYRTEIERPSADREWQEPIQLACFWCAVSTWVLGALLAARVFPNYPTGLSLGTARYVGCGYVKDTDVAEPDEEAAGAEPGDGRPGAAVPVAAPSAVPRAVPITATAARGAAEEKEDEDTGLTTPLAAAATAPTTAGGGSSSSSPTLFHFRALDVMILTSLVGLGAGKHDNLSLVYAVMQPSVWALLSAVRGSPVFVMLSVLVACACAGGMYTPADESYTYVTLPLAFSGAVLLLVRLVTRSVWWTVIHKWIYGQNDQLVPAWIPGNGARLAVGTEVVGTALMLGMSCIGLYILPLTLNPDDDDVDRLWWAFISLVLVWAIAQMAVGFKFEDQGFRRMAGALAVATAVFLCLPATEGGSVEQAVLLLVGAVLIIVTLGVFAYWFYTKSATRRRRGETPTSQEVGAGATSAPTAATPQAT